MASLETANQTSFGFDEHRSQLAMKLGESYPMRLMFGGTLKLEIDPKYGSVATLADVDETDSNSRRFSIKAVGPGEAVLTGRLTADLGDWKAGGDFIEPLTIRVTRTDTKHRQASGGSVMQDDFRAELRKLCASGPGGWRQAVIRIAEDQMNSDVGRTTDGGKGVYDDPAENWCGSFVTWCFDVLAAARGGASPFGTGLAVESALRSGIKALSWGLQNPSKGKVLNYEGADRFKGGAATKLNPVKFGDLLRGDLCLPRDEHGVFRHVAIVYDPPGASGGTFTTMNGNTFGSFVPSGMSRSAGCIALGQGDSNEMLTIRETAWTTKKKDGTTVDHKASDPMGHRFPKYVFVHLNDW